MAGPSLQILAAARSRGGQVGAIPMPRLFNCMQTPWRPTPPSALWTPPVAETWRTIDTTAPRKPCNSSNGISTPQWYALSKPALIRPQSSTSLTGLFDALPRALRRLLARPRYQRPWLDARQRSRRVYRSDDPVVAHLRRISPTTIVALIAAINVGIWGLWQYSIALTEQYGDGHLFSTLCQNFICSWDNLRHLRPHTLVTAMFSHIKFDHLFVNMLTLYFFSLEVAKMVGTPYFLGIYTTCGLAGFACSLVCEKLIPNRDQPMNRLGASAAIMGTMGYLASALPRATVMLYFIIPVPVSVAVAGLIGYEFYSTLRSQRGIQGATTDSAGHLGGLIGGILFHRRRLPF